jgi:hypothetical protein
MYKLIRSIRMRGSIVMLSRSEASPRQERQAFTAAQGDSLLKQQAWQHCHAEPQRSISTPGATDPSLRLRVTVEGPISSSGLFFETGSSAHGADSYVHIL